MLRLCNLLLHFPIHFMLRFCNSINSTVGGKPNKNLWMYMRSQQWRWECHDKDILAFTGQPLQICEEEKRDVRIRLVLGHKTL